MNSSGAIRLCAVAAVALALAEAVVNAATPCPGEARLADYFRAETAKLSTNCLAEIGTLADWQARREGYRQQLFEMLGLWPMPEKSDLRPVVTGKLECDGFTVEKLHFQSLPGLYVTANLYLPKGQAQPAPTILYVCGHALVVTNGVSCGNKAFYQHHSEWFARNGYGCLILDTIELGELQGTHHGTYREGMWWWNSRGYTPAGVEAWNSIRALDYLETRPEVDAQHLGVTGRSGGGAYSWWLAALDDRIKVAAPVAGITDLWNHVVDGTVEGHCDCMFTVNTYRWDYPQIAALVAPRPLLLGNSDKDTIFPLDGVERLHAKVRRIYELYQATNKLGLLITEGPHADTQDLQLPVFRWFNRHLRGKDPVIEMAALKLLPPTQLRVFDQLPTDERTTKIHETFVPTAAPPPLPATRQAWEQQRASWLEALRRKCFGGWPESPRSLDLRRAWTATREGLRLEAWDFASQDHVQLRVYLARTSRTKRPERMVLKVVDEDGWARWIAALGTMFPGELAAETALLDSQGRASVRSGGTQMLRELGQAGQVVALVAPRGLGLDEWTRDTKKLVQLRRRFMLLGQTVDGMRVWDLRRAVQAVRSIPGLDRTAVTLEASDTLAADALYAALWEPAVTSLELWRLPKSHRDGPDYLNVLRLLDLPQTLAMVAERAAVTLHETDPASWDYPVAVSKRLGWGSGRVGFAAK